MVPSPPDPFAGDVPNILVVDDNPGNLAVLEDMLNHAGYAVRPAISGELALLSARTRPPDLVLLDIRLPDIDGYRVCRQLKSEGPTSDVPVIFLSALDDPLDKIRAFSEGGVDYVTKPFQAEEIMVRIRTHLSIRRMQQTLVRQNNQLQKEVRERQEAQQQLQQAHHELEERVRKRTGELAETVLDLESEIEERRQTERALRESEARYRTAIESEFAGIALVDVDRILFLNNRFLNIFGFERKEELLDKSFSCLFDPGGREKIEAVLDECVCGGRPSFQGEFKARASNGQRLWLELHVTATTHRQDSVALIYTRDITTSRRAVEESLLLATAMAQTAESIIITDAQARILYVNPYFEKITGYSRSEVLGQTPAILKSGHHSPEFYQQIRTRLQAGQGWQGRFVNRCRDGSLIDEDAVISPVFDGDGAISHYIAVKRDITRSLQLERQLQQAQKLEAVGTLAGGIAHDFNNILGAIMGCAEIAMNELPRSSRAQADLKRVLSAGQRARELVQQILTFSHQSETRPQPLKLQPIIKETIKFLRATLPATINITSSLTREDRLIQADPVQVQQILLNLATNAAHAMGGGSGNLDIRLTAVTLGEEEAEQTGALAPGDYLVLAVQDTGHGMNPITVSRIFDPFYTTKAIGEGTGLGLSVVHGIITGLGGRVLVHSQPEEGTVFLIYLPVTERQQIPREESSPPLRSMRGERILVIDDEPYLSETAGKYLKYLGYSPEVFTAAQEALAVFCRSPEKFDVILTDLTMPGMTGKELAAEARRVRPDIPVILCTGYSPDGADCIEGGLITTILYKPVLQYQLAQTLYEILQSDEP